MTLVDWIPSTLAVFAQLLPGLAVVARWSQSSKARRWIAFWCFFFFISDMVQLAIARTSGNNLWYFTYAEPIEDSMLLWALSHWQSKPVARIALRLAIPLVVVGWLAMTFATGEQDALKTISHPFRAIVIMLLTAYTLTSNLAATPERVWSRDWLWTCLGVLLYFGIFAAIDPIISAMDPTDFRAMLNVYNAKAAFDLVAFILIWRGMRCPIPSSSSGSM